MKKTGLFIIALWSASLLYGQWVQLGADISGEATADEFGFSASLSSDGTRLAVGARLNDGVNGANSGQVRVFEWDGSAWQQMGADIDGQAADDEFGWSVALSADGTLVAAGARKSNSNGGDSGQVRVFAWDGTAWVQQGADLNGEIAAALFGFSVSLSADGTRLAVGAVRKDTNNGEDTGQVRVFNWDGSQWLQLGAAIDGEAELDEMGRSVALSSAGTRLAVSASKYDGMSGTNVGQVRVFTWDGTQWSALGQALEGTASGDEFGWSVALSDDGNYLAAGAKFNDGSNGADSGHVRVFKWQNGTWQPIGQVLEGAAAGDEFGWAVALSADGSRLLVGARLHDGLKGPDSGQVSVYEWSGIHWTQLGAGVDGQAAGDEFGVSVALSADGSRFYAGARLHDGPNGVNTGQARVYEGFIRLLVQLPLMLRNYVLALGLTIMGFGGYLLVAGRDYQRDRIAVFR